METKSRHFTSLKTFLPWLVAVAFFMEALDTTILNTAVPVIAAALKVTPLSMKSVLSSYTLSVAVFIPISSWVADRFGTRRVFATAIGIFTLGSLLCGIVSNIHLLIFCRVIQGFGGAMMVPVGRLTLVRTFEKSELVQAMSFVVIPALIGPLLGPVVGGFMVGFLHWRAIFFVNVPIGIVGLYFVYRYLPDYKAEKNDPLDVVGLLLFSSGIALLSYVLEVFGEHTLSVPKEILLLILSVGLLFSYGRHARHKDSPLLQLNLFRIRTLRISVLGNFITRLGVGGLPFLLPLLYQVGLGYTPVQSGLLMMPQTLAAMGLRFGAAYILTRMGYRKLMLTNTLIIGALMILFATINLHTPVWIIVVQSALFGFASALHYTSMNSLAYADIPGYQMSMASMIVSTVQQMSLSFGIATASLVTALFIPDRTHTDPAQMVHGIHVCVMILGAMTILSALLFRRLKETDGISISQHEVVEP